MLLSKGNHEMPTGAEQGRRDELADAAVDHVLEHGVIGLTLRPLAKALGTSDRMLVYHFGSRDALVEEVLERANARLVGILGRRTRPARTPGGAVRALWKLHSDPMVLPFVRLWLEGSVLTLRDPGRFLPVHRRATGPWLELTAEALRSSGMGAARAGRLATLVLDALDGLHEDLLLTGDQVRVSAAVRDLADLVDHAARSE